MKEKEKILNFLNLQKLLILEDERKAKPTKEEKTQNDLLINYTNFLIDEFKKMDKKEI